MHLFTKINFKRASGKEKKAFDYKSLWTNSLRFLLVVAKIVLIFVLILSFTASGAIGGAILGYIKTAEPLSPDDLIIKTENSYVYDADGKQIAQLAGSENKNMVQVKYNEIPDYLKEAIVAIEDERFWEHPGVDLVRIGGMIWSGIKNLGDPEFGASTITQQLARNITGNTKRSLGRKVQEWWQAYQLEKKYEKWQILETYLNIIYMGYNYYGVQSASRAYLGKDVSELSLAECALLAGITNLPGKYNPRTEKGRENAIMRQQTILGKMLELGKITKEEYEEAKKEVIRFVEPDEMEKVSSTQSYFVDQVILDVARDLAMEKGISEVEARRRIYNNGYKIYTTQDTRMQTAMDEVFNDPQYFPVLDKNGNYINSDAKKYEEIPQAAMVIIDPFSGHVKAMYGGNGEKTKNLAFNRATQAKRQPGSSIKPIAIYGPAIDLQLITPATIVEDAPTHLDTANPEKLWPNNAETRTIEGLTSIRNAIKASVNIVAVKVLKDPLGLDSALEYLKKVGIHLNPEKDRNLALGLGALYEGVTPLQMAAAYGSFVNKGLYYEPITYTKVVDRNGKTILEKQPNYNVVYDEESAYLMVDMMREVTLGRTSPYPHSGTAASRIRIQDGKMPVAGKTGTSGDNVDKWFVGYTPYYTAAVWYGYDNKVKRISLRSTEYGQAQLIWDAVMEKVHENLPPKDFYVPTGIVEERICIYSGKLASDLCTHDPRGNATINQVFIKGTEPKETCNVHVTAKVCKESTDIWGRNLLAGPYCPPSSVEERVFIQRPRPYTPEYPGDPYPLDWKYELPAGEYCTLHGEPQAPSPENFGDTLNEMIYGIFQLEENR